MDRGQVPLARDGKALASIVISENADRTVRFASRELRKYLCRMSGADVPVTGDRRSVDGPVIALGSASGIAVRSGPIDEYTVRVGDNRVAICGTNSRSTLYGVYDFLEQLGCEFIEPGIEHVPRKESVFAAAANRKESAAFALRSIMRNAWFCFREKKDFIFLNSDLVIPQIDWMAKRRLNHHDFYVDYFRYDLWEKHKKNVLEAFLDRGFDLEVTSHSSHYFCPPDADHDFGNFGPETYAINHPDWYVLPPDPKRWQIRIELPAVQKILIARYLEYFARNPELKILGLWPEDTLPTPIKNPPFKGMSNTDGYLKLWNKVGEALAHDMPDKCVGMLAYYGLIHPPERVRPRDNLHCWFCPIERNYAYPIADKQNKHYLKKLKGWTTSMAPYHVALFEYYGCEGNIFIPFREYMADDLRMYKDLKLGGLYGWCGYGNNIMGENYRWALDLYVLAHLLWNPDANIGKLENQWALRVFGGAAPGVLEFYRFIKTAFDKEARKGLPWKGPLSGKPWMNLDTIHKAQDILAAACRKAATEDALCRLNLLERTTFLGISVETIGQGKDRKYPGM